MQLTPEQTYQIAYGIGGVLSFIGSLICFVRILSKERHPAPFEVVAIHCVMAVIIGCFWIAAVPGIFLVLGIHHLVKHLVSKRNGY